MFQFLNTYHTCQEKNIQPKDLSNELAHAKPLLMSLKSTINVIKSYKKRQLALIGSNRLAIKNNRQTYENTKQFLY